MNEIQNYIDEKKKLQNNLLQFIENESNTESNFQSLVNYIHDNKILNERDEIIEFLHLISNIALNHYRNTNFFENIKQILHKYSDTIKQTLSNFTIFNIFKRNHIILLFLFKEKIITIEPSIFKYLYTKNRYFFFNEIKPLLSNEQCESITKELESKDSQIMTKFEENRQIGENDSKICTLIRNDSVDDFIVFVSETNYPLTSKIKPSIFETNSYLLKKKPTLIEYAAFFGSIKIIKYIINRKVIIEELPELMYFAIHSNNAEVIQLLEENGCQFNYKTCLQESVKCHHIEIYFFFWNLVENEVKSYASRYKIMENSFSEGFHRHNYECLPLNFYSQTSFIYSVFKYDYLSIAKIYLKGKELNLKEPLISIIMHL